MLSIVNERYEVALDRDKAIQLARALRDLRISTWPDREVTQSQLAKALSSEGRVAGPTLSSWEALTSPKTPPVSRISAYARFFCTPRSLEDEPHLIPEDQLTPEELDRFRELESQLLQRFRPEELALQHIFRFDVGPVVVICPDTPTKVQGSLAKEDDPNFTKLQQYGDLDALIQLYGHLRAETQASTCSTSSRVKLCRTITAVTSSCSAGLAGIKPPGISKVSLTKSLSGR
jgi:hypothetical protein